MGEVAYKLTGGESGGRIRKNAPQKLINAPLDAGERSFESRCMLLWVACDIIDPFLILKGSTFDIVAHALLCIGKGPVYGGRPGLAGTPIGEGALCHGRFKFLSLYRCSFRGNTLPLSSNTESSMTNNSPSRQYVIHPGKGNQKPPGICIPFKIMGKL